MWLMTRHGFYSIVQKDDGIHIRARERGDLQRLYDECILKFNAEMRRINGNNSLLKASILETPDNDYRFRIIVDRDVLHLVMDWLARTCDYPNFKGQIDKEPSQARKPYHQVWDLMARALGAYGRAVSSTTYLIDRKGEI